VWIWVRKMCPKQGVVIPAIRSFFQGRDLIEVDARGMGGGSGGIKFEFPKPKRNPQRNNVLSGDGAVYVIRSRTMDLEIYEWHS